MDTHIIDLVAFDEILKVVNLIIIDDQNWETPREHIDMIQEKILSYVAFIENGTLKKKYPSVADLDTIIKVIFEYKPTEEGIKFIEQVKTVLEDTGYQLEFINYEDTSI
ncbi:MAG: hypothetical protein JEZ08_13820 [Clostridiales bacterium]|nr:hypothetical protein [Clostridiales bacterium]